MSFDIYGNTLRCGFCEVHPHVNEEYPCSLCLAERDRRQRERDEYERAQRLAYEAQMAEMIGDIEYESWFETLPPCTSHKPNQGENRG